MRKRIVAGLFLLCGAAACSSATPPTQNAASEQGEVEPGAVESAEVESDPRLSPATVVVESPMSDALESQFAAKMIEGGAALLSTARGQVVDGWSKPGLVIDPEVGASIAALGDDVEVFGTLAEIKLRGEQSISGAVFVFADGRVRFLVLNHYAESFGESSTVYEDSFPELTGYVRSIPERLASSSSDCGLTPISSADLADLPPVLATDLLRRAQTPEELCALPTEIGEFRAGIGDFTIVVRAGDDIGVLRSQLNADPAGFESIRFREMQ